VPGAPTLTPGAPLSGLDLVSRRGLGLVQVDADTAKAECDYIVGAEHVVPTNAAPELAAASVTGQGKTLRAGQQLTFLASATDVDGDHLTTTGRSATVRRAKERCSSTLCPRPGPSPRS